jgi:hypothetical protein
MSAYVLIPNSEVRALGRELGVSEEQVMRHVSSYFVFLFSI